MDVNKIIILLQNIWKWLCKVKDNISFIIALTILWSLVGYFLGLPISYMLMIYFLMGAWAIKIVAPKMKPAQKPIRLMLIYSLAYYSVVSTVYIYFRSTLQVIYESWAFDRSFWNFFMLIGPAITIGGGALYLASITINKKVLRDIVIICIVLCSVNLVVFGLFPDINKWQVAYVYALRQNVNQARDERIKKLGQFVRVIRPGAKAYLPDGKLWRVEAELDVKILYPISENDQDSIDGTYKLKPVWLPDENGEFSSLGHIAYVRYDDIEIKSKTNEDLLSVFGKAKKAVLGGNSTFKRSSSKHEFDEKKEGTYEIILGEGETTNWILIPANYNYDIYSPTNDQWELFFWEGERFGFNSQEKFYKFPEKQNAIFKIEVNKIDKEGEKKKIILKIWPKNKNV